MGKSINPRKSALNTLNRFFSGQNSLKDAISDELDGSSLGGIDRRFFFNLAKVELIL